MNTTIPRKFAALAGLKDKLPEGKTPKQVAEVEKKRPARAVVRLERTGRSGKEVTIVSHLDLPVMERDVWLKALKTGLGCGGLRRTSWSQCSSGCEMACRLSPQGVILEPMWNLGVFG